jgi:hypothetical protein
MRTINERETATMTRKTCDPLSIAAPQVVILHARLARQQCGAMNLMNIQMSFSRGLLSPVRLARFSTV